MSFFSKILDKLGFNRNNTAQASEQPQTQAPTADASVSAPQGSNAISAVDVIAQLEALSASSTEKLNWKTSIVDLLKLLGLDSSLTARKELAQELGCPAEQLEDSAQMNMWLHKTVLQKLADNGGNIPQELL